jgi:hypothetical protein
MRAEWGRGGSAALARPLADDGAPSSSAVIGDRPAATALGSASSARLGKRCSASGGTPSGGTPRGAEVGVGDGALPSGVAAAARAAAAAAARDAALVGVLLWRGLLVDMGMETLAVDLDV